MREHTYYIVVIDNGADYCGNLPGKFDTEEAAEQAGENWLQEFYVNNGVAPEDQEDDEAGWEVKEIECPGCEECCTEDCPGCAYCHEDRAPHE